jgi:acyl dehydratase
VDTRLVPLHQPAGPFTGYCDPDEVIAFALATNDPNPLYLEGRATPPIYPAVPVFAPMMAAAELPSQAIEGMTGRVHGTHDLYIHKLIEPGTHLHTMYEKCTVTASRAGMNVVIRLTSRDDAGELVVDQYWSSLLRGPVTGGDRGVQLPDHNFPDRARANPVGTVSLATSRDQTFRYAGASGDRSPMHVNDEVARGYGFPRKFNQGMCTLALASRGLAELTANADPRRIFRIAVRFAAPSFPGDDVEVAVYRIGEIEPGLSSYAFEAVSGGQTVLRHGRVEVRSKVPNA